MTARLPAIPQPTPAGWAVLAGSVALVGAGLLADYPELIAIGVTGVVLLVLGLGWTARSPVLRSERRFLTDRIAEGDDVACQLTVRNPSRHRIRSSEVVEPMAVTPIPLPAIQPGGQYETGYAIAFPRRGRHLLAPPYLRWTDPLGLVQSGTASGPVTEVLVHPRIHQVRVPGLDRNSTPTRSAAGMPAPAAMSWHSLRRYVPGDDSRLIHWMSSARMSTGRLGDLLVREERVSPHRPAYVVVLDVVAENHPSGAFEEAVRIAASLCVAAIRAGVRTTLYAGREVVAVGDSGRRGAGEMAVLDFLATVTTVAAEPAFRPPAAPRYPSALTVVTGQWPAVGWPALGEMATRWSSVTIVAVDADSAGPVTASGSVVRVRTCADFAARRLP